MGNNYIFSTTTEKDCISMWSYYSDNMDAYSIEFDRSKLKKVLYDIFEEKLFFGEVFYSDKDIKQYVESFFSIFEPFYKKNFPLSPERLIDFSFNIKNGMSFIYSLVKQYGHHSEKEYRFSVNFNESIKKENVRLDFENKRGLFVPTLKVNVEGKLPILKIMLGPKNSNDLAEASLRRYLDSKGYTDVEIERSALLIR